MTFRAKIKIADKSILTEIFYYRVLEVNEISALQKNHRFFITSFKKFGDVIAYLIATRTDTGTEYISVFTHKSLGFPGNFSYDPAPAAMDHAHFLLIKKKNRQAVSDLYPENQVFLPGDDTVTDPVFGPVYVNNPIGMDLLEQGRFKTIKKFLIRRYR